MKPSVRYSFHSLEDYLISSRLDANGLLDDGWGAHFPVKGREIEATILFADISDFSGRTYDLSPTETLVFVNNFFTWITAEGLRGRPGIVDKYIGDEMMVVFSKEFGSDDPVVDAVLTARAMIDGDVLGFCPHIGIAHGSVCVGYVGTPLRYSVSVFGRPVAVAARCCGIKSLSHINFIAMPADTWGDRKIDDHFKGRNYELPDGTIQEQPHFWSIEGPRHVEMKNMPDIEIVELVSDLMHMPSLSADQRAKKSVEGLAKEGSYKRLRYGFELSDEPGKSNKVPPLTSPAAETPSKP